MSTITSLTGLCNNVNTVLDVVTRNVKSLTKVSRPLFKPPFELVFQVCGGPYTNPEPPSPPLSDEEESDGGDDAASTVVVSARSAYSAILMILVVTVEQQVELSRRVLSQATVRSVVEVAMRSCEPLAPVLYQCNDYLHGPDSAAAAETLDAPCGAFLEKWVECAREVARRTRALLAWVKLQKIGDTAMLVAPASSDKDGAPRQPPVPATAAAAVEGAVSAPPPPPAAAAAAPAFVQAARHASPPTVVARQSTADVAPAPEQSIPEPHLRAPFFATSDPDDVDDSGSDFGRHAMDATNLLQDWESELTFNVPKVQAAPIEADAATDPAALLARSVNRGRKLLKGRLEQTQEPMSDARVKAVKQSATARDMMGVLGLSDYNILAFQVRTMSHPVGEGGPVLWSGALDLLVGDGGSVEEEEVPKKRWLEERIATAIPAPTPEDKGRWMELVHSESCVRGAQAKLRAVTMGAQLLFPREFELYCSLQRDDVPGPDGTVDELYPTGLEGGRDILLGKTISFKVDRNSSFIAQAFDIIQAHRSDVGLLRLEIEVQRSPGNCYMAPTEVESYTVRIYRGDGKTEVTSQSSRDYAQQSSGVSRPALVPAVVDALHKAASQLGVKDDYEQLRGSFDRVCLPVSNEPREYITSYFTLFFGMRVGPDGAAKDPVELVEQPVAGGWSTALRVAYPRTPTDSRNGFLFVDVETRHCATKKVARNEALMYAGKTNFTAELLRMMEYGTAPQKGQAETILVTPTSGVIPLQHPISRKVRALVEHSAAQGGMSWALGRGRFGSPSPCNVLLADAIERNLTLAVKEMTVWLQQTFTDLQCKLYIDAEAVKRFLAEAPAEVMHFGALNYSRLSPAGSATSNEADVQESILISGRSPIYALFSATRVLREKIDGEKEATRTQVKEVRRADPSTASKEAAAAADATSGTVSKPPRQTAGGDLIPPQPIPL